MKTINLCEKKKTADFWVTAVFIILEAILYCLFMTIDLKGYKDTTLLKYIAICLCLAYATLRLTKNGIDSLIIFLALTFTVLSDTFTLLINDHFTLGVSLFIPAQLLYGLRIRFWAKKPLYKSIFIRFCVVLAVVIGVACAQIADSLTVVTAIYFSMLLYNGIESLFFAKSPNKIAFAIGLWLFICCDICVGLFNLTDVLGVAINPKLYNFASVMMWGFYLPSQALIVTSVKVENHKI